MTPLTRCLACDSINLFKVLDLGYQPLANDYDSDEVYPLSLNACEKCWHAQLSISVDPEKLYRNYNYVSGTSNTLKQWFSDFADRFNKVGAVLDVASNDGSLLLEFKQRGWVTLGIDPATNLDTQGVETIHEFFNEDVLGEFDVITAFNVLAHGPNPLSIMKGIYNNLAPEGEAYVMTSQAKMFENGQFDTIYHEHHSFFSEKSFHTLARRAGFSDISCTIEPIHGGSMLFKLTKSKRITTLLSERPDFEGFSDKVEKIRPYRIVGFGAAAKGVVVINALKQQLDYVVDEAPLKIGNNIPGTSIPVVDVQHLAADPDDLVIVVYAWNFYDEIVDKVKRLRPQHNDIFKRYWQ